MPSAYACPASVIKIGPELGAECVNACCADGALHRTAVQSGADRRPARWLPVPRRGPTSTLK